MEEHYDYDDDPFLDLEDGFLYVEDEFGLAVSTLALIVSAACSGVPGSWDRFHWP